MFRSRDLDWSEREWNPQHQHWERYRIDSSGGYIWEYDTTSPPPDATPRSLSNLFHDSEASQASSDFHTGFQTTTAYRQQPPYTSDLGYGYAQELSYSSPNSGANTDLNHGSTQQSYPSLAINVPPNADFAENKITWEDVTEHNGRSNRGYRVHPSRDFEFGKILKIYWSEPRGKNNTVITARADKSHSKVRRFLIINTRQGHSICLAIHTYDGRGTTKKVILKDHAVIHSTDKPEPVKGENLSLLKRPIRCRMDRSEKLHPASRLNYAKPYTIEHNCDVQFIGRISRSCYDRVALDYNMTHPTIVAPPRGSESPEYTATAPQAGEMSSFAPLSPPAYGVYQSETGESSYQGLFQQAQYSLNTLETGGSSYQ